MSVVSAQVVTVDFTTRNGLTGVGVNADSLPVGTLIKNGVNNGATVTVTNISTGLYKASVTLPTLAIEDIVQLSIAATVNTVADTAIIWTDTADLNIDASGEVFLSTTQAFSNTGNWTGNLSGSVGSVTGNVGGISGVTFPTNFGSLLINSGGYVGTQYPLHKNTAYSNFGVYMTLTGSNLPATGKTVAGQVSLDGGAFSALTNTPCTEIGSGWYKINLAAGDLNATEVLMIFTATGCNASLYKIPMAG